MITSITNSSEENPLALMAPGSIDESQRNQSRSVASVVQVLSDVSNQFRREIQRGGSIGHAGKEKKDTMSVCSSFLIGVEIGNGEI